MHDLWEWVKQNKEGITLFCTILGGVATLTAILSKVWRWRAARKSGQAQALLPMELQRPLPAWPEELLARTVSIDALRGGFPVAPRTRMLVLDRGVRQFSREPGPCTASDVKRLFEAHNIGSGAHGLQYLTIPVELDSAVTGCKSKDGYTDVESIVNVQVRVDDASAERLAEWHLSHDGVVEAVEVAQTLAVTIEQWLKSRTAQLDFDALSQVFGGLRADAEGILQPELVNHGLIAAVRSFQFRSKQREASGHSVQNRISDFRTAIEADLQRRRGGEK